MRLVVRGVDLVSEWSGKLISVVAFFMVCILVYEVTMRYAFVAPTIWAHELTQHLFGAYSVLAGAYVLLHRQHIGVDVIYNRFSSRGRAILDSVTYLLFFLIIGILLWHGIGIAQWSVAIRQTVSPSPWASPLWPLKLTVPIAAFLMFAQGLAHFIRALTIAITGKELK